MKRMTFDLEPDIHRRLKLLAVESGKAMRDIIVAWIRANLPPAQGEAGEPRPKKKG